jgi:hypothetical protein
MNITPCFNCYTTPKHNFATLESSPHPTTPPPTHTHIPCIPHNLAVHTLTADSTRHLSTEDESNGTYPLNCIGASNSVTRLFSLKMSRQGRNM